MLCVVLFVVAVAVAVAIAVAAAAVVVVSDATMREQCSCQQRPMNCAREQSMAKNSSPSRAPKTGSTPGQAGGAQKNASEPPKTPSHRHVTDFQVRTVQGSPSPPSR